MDPIVSVYFLLFLCAIDQVTKMRRPGSAVTRHFKCVLGTTREVVVYLLVDTLYLNKY